MKVRVNDNLFIEVEDLEEKQRGLCCLDVKCMQARNTLEEERIGKKLCEDCIFQDNKEPSYIFYIDIEKLRKEGRIK